MKIAQVCPYDFTRHGGVKTHIEQLSEALRAKGHEVHIIAPKSANAVDIANLHCFGKNFSMPFLGTKIDVNAAIGSEFRSLRKFLRQEKFDLIHFHTIWNPFIPFQVLFLSRAKRVATFHDSPKNNVIGKFLGGFVMPGLARMIFTQLEGIISVSESQSKFIKRFSKREIKIVPNGISPSSSDLSEPKNADKLNLLFLGRLEPRKGVTSALRAFETIQNTIDNVQLRIAGEGELLGSAQEFVENHKLKNVEFLGKVSDSEKWDLFDWADIYLASAEYGESFGIVLLEAMSQSVLLSGYANAGYKNVLTKTQLEFFAEPGDWLGLARRTIELIKLKQDKSRSLAIEGAAVAQNYNWEKLVEEVLEVYY